ncbi:MAG: hybrid sensor histidine kinase/response regulator [Gammaproteobacteria bacterium]|nr:MAG: hybrid sensor histidine kinase/response regulator [Gammaproteobacteria bacterium]
MARSSQTEGDGPRIAQEQIRVLYRHYPLLLLVNTLLLLAMMLVFRERAGSLPLGAWAALFTLVLGMRHLSYRGFCRGNGTPAAVWGRRFIAWTALTGLFWGLGAAWLHGPSAAEERYFILFVLMGLGAGAFTSLTAWLPAFLAFVVPAIAPLALVLLFTHGGQDRVLGAICLIYIAGLGFFGRNLSAVLRESLELRFRNLSLVGELRYQKAQAERANRNKSRFLSAASHDLRQPLHALSLFIESLRNANRQPELEPTLRNAEASAAGLRDLFNRLLDISRLDAGALKPAIADFHLQPLFRRLDLDCRPMAAERGLSLEIAEGDHWVRSDPLLLEQILRNLLGNALRYTTEGRVSLRSLEGPEGIVLEVADTGCGIPAERQKEIFGEFVKLDAGAGDGRAGLGLGLAIVERMANLLGHPLQLVSTPGRGSVFSLTVPPGRAGAGSAPQTTAGPGHELAGLRILVVEDDPEVAEATATLLRGWGCIPGIADSADHAVAACTEDGAPDLILSDHRLQGAASGVEVVLEARRRLRRDLPAAIITGDTDPAVVPEVKAAGLPLLRKPVQPAALRALVRNLTRRYG